MVQVERAAEAVAPLFLYGLIAEFQAADQVVSAARAAREAGYRRVDAYTPIPVPGLAEALGFRDRWIPALMFAGGLLGTLGGFAFLYWAMAIDYPVNIGGRPLFAWASSVPIAFEVAVLLSALAGTIGMLVLNGLPMPYHPLFDAPGFSRATSDRFFLCIEARDARFDRRETRRFLESLGPERV